MSTIADIRTGQVIRFLRPGHRNRTTVVVRKLVHESHGHLAFEAYYAKVEGERTISRGEPQLFSVRTDRPVEILKES